MRAVRGPTRAVVFDLDGTLLDSLGFVLRALEHALEPYGVRPTAEIFTRLGGPPQRFLPELIPDPQGADEVLARLAAYHHTHGHLLQPYLGAAELLHALHAADVRLGIWTGRDRSSAITLLRRLGLESLFGIVVCGDDLATHKPDPAGLRLILDRLAVTPESALYVGDADVDAEGGFAAGVDTLLIRHGSRTIPATVQTCCWHSVASASDAYATVTRRVLSDTQL
jgi:HAD superfamily hydrolase (TIGR01509 family)